MFKILIIFYSIEIPSIEMLLSNISHQFNNKYPWETDLLKGT